MKPPGRPVFVLPVQSSPVWCLASAVLAVLLLHVLLFCVCFVLFGHFALHFCVSWVPAKSVGWAGEVSLFFFLLLFMSVFVLCVVVVSLSCWVPVLH